MSIKLKKGGAFNLTKNAPALSKILIGLGWEMLPGNPLDLDVSVFMINKNGKLPEDEYFVFYNNLKSPDGAVQHTGDNRSGFGDGDDEMVLCNLNLINSNVEEILITATIYEAHERKHHFGLLKDAYIRLVDVELNKEVVLYDLDELNPTDSGVLFGKLQRTNNEWHFVAMGEGNGAKGLQGFVDKYA